MPPLLLFGSSLLAVAMSLAADAPAPPPHADVEITGGLSSPYVRSGSTVNFWIRIVNHSSADLTGLTFGPLDVAGPFSLAKCWSGEPALVELPAHQVCHIALDSLGPDQVASIGGTIQASQHANQEFVGAIVRWTSHKLPSSSEVTLGPLSSDSAFTYTLETHAVLVSFFGVALLAVIAYLLRFEFERWRQKKERQRSRQAETWAQLLEEASKNSLKYYLPAEAALENFLANAKAHRAESAGFLDAAESIAKVSLQLRLAFFYWALFERRMTQIRLHLNGLHFKNYTGEEIVGGAYYSYQLLFYFRTHGERDVVDALMDKTPLEATSTKFLRLLDGFADVPPDPDILKAWRLFHRWIHGSDAGKALRLLGAMQPIFLFEVNRPYYYWYGYLDPLTLDGSQLDDLRSIAEKAPPGSSPAVTAQANAEIKLWHKKINLYISGTKKAG